jgi:hemerythrin superfamily protein
VPVDPFSMLETDHRQVERMLKKLADSEPGPERRATVDQLTSALQVHMQYEEAAVYPLVIKVIDEKTEREAQIEHKLARDGVAKLHELVDQPGFGAVVEMLKGGIGHHVEEEEKEIFPKLRRELDAGTKEQLADALIRSKKSAGLPAVDPDAASKEELLKAAADAGIEGRSKMTKEELAEAINAR